MNSFREKTKNIVQKYWLKRDKIDLNLASGTSPYGKIRIDCRLLENVNIIGDVRKVPLPSSCSNYVLASHILEHFWPQDWEKIVLEWLRVTKKELIIEVPNYHSFSNIFPLIYAAFGFEKKWLESQIIGGPPGEYFSLHKSLVTYKRLKTFFSDLKSKDDISFKIYGKYLDLFGSESLGVLTMLLTVDKYFPWFTRNFLVYIKKNQRNNQKVENNPKKDKKHVNQNTISESRYMKNIDPNVLSVLVCPQCHGNLFFDKYYIVCKKCNLEYPVINGIPIMFTKESEYYHVYQGVIQLGEKIL